MQNRDRRWLAVKKFQVPPAVILPHYYYNLRACYKFLLMKLFDITQAADCNISINPWLNIFCFIKICFNKYLYIYCIYIGPGTYVLPDHMGQTGGGRKDTLYNVKFGKSKRDAKAGFVSEIGPGEYRVEGAFGGQICHPNEPTVVFGKEERMKDKSVNPYLPEPMRLNSPPSMGRQIDSRRNNAPQSSMSGRESFGSNVKISYGPGPGSNGTTSAFGIQQLSTKKTLKGGAVMGTSWRAVETHLDDAPGPGQYNIPAFIGAGGTVTKKACPAFSIRGREKFGSVMDSKDAAKLPG